MNKAFISHIQHFSIGDGPGIRTTVFLKGCRLHCPWCHNPETWQNAPQLLFYAAKCRACGVCAGVCPNGAHIMQGGQHLFLRENCTGCGKCAPLCASRALEISGSEMTAQAVFAQIAEDADYYESSGGGATLSGGEPLLQADFCAELVALCRNAGIAVLTETCADVPFSAFKSLLRQGANRFYVDLKAVSQEQYALLGGDFERICRNIGALVQCGADVTLRVPLIPGFNDSPDFMQKAGALGVSLGVQKVELLPFHRLGAGKYQALGKHYAYADVPPPSAERINAMKTVLASSGLTLIHE